MAIDTRDKRASVLGVDSSAPRLEQNPSGTIGRSGRQIAGLIYSGIAALPRVAPWVDPPRGDRRPFPFLPSGAWYR